jgi:predicted P-loop ATPase
VGDFVIDLNDVEGASLFQRHDIDRIVDGLRRHAGTWGPELFPFGRLEGDSLRMADLFGRAPKKQGSTVLSLKGEHAGEIYDFSMRQGGGPLDALSYATALTGRALLDRAAEIAGISLNGAAGAPRAADIKKNTNRKSKAQQEIEFTLAKCQPLAGTLGETYLQARGLTDPQCEDLLFCPDLTEWEGKRGWPGIVARLRTPERDLLGAIHRTYLAEDGQGKAPLPAGNRKKSLGTFATDAAAVQLYAPENGRLGVAEGIETAIAARILFGIPTWSLVSAGNFINFRPPAGISHVTIFADSGRDGEACARALATKLMALQIETEVMLPEHGDDFNHDLMVRRGIVLLPPAPAVTAAEPIVEPPVPDPAPAPAPTGIIDLTAPAVPSEPIAAIAPVAAIAPGGVVIPGQGIAQMLLDRARALPAKSSFDDVKDIIIGMASHQIEPLDRRNLFNELKRATGVSMTVLEDELKAQRKRLHTSVPVNLPTWMSKMALWENGEPKHIMSNIAVVFDEEPSCRGIFGFDDFARRPVMVKRPPWEASWPGNWQIRSIEDADTLSATNWIQNLGIHAPSTIVRQGMEFCADKFHFHPVREYLENLEWDKQPRIERWLAYYIGAEAPSWADQLKFASYLSAIGSAFLISMVARILNPGCKVDTVLTLEGPQGKKKSMVAETLARPWFRDDVANFGSKDAPMQLEGVWLMELSELQSISKSEIDIIKAFISRKLDHYRPPFGHFVVDRHRETVFFGTTNEEAWIRDDTGGRRFWPVRCGEIDIDSLAQDRDQLFAEAVAAYRHGAKWYLTDDEIVETATLEQSARQQGDPWHSKIARHLQASVLSKMSPEDVLGSCLNIETGRWSRQELLRVQKIFTRLGWTREPDPHHAEGWLYSRPG